jgi:hypothetical protein
MIPFARPAKMPALVALLTWGVVLLAATPGRADTVSITSASISESGGVLIPTGTTLVPTSNTSSPSGNVSFDTGLQSATFASGSGSHEGTLTSTITTNASGVMGINALATSSTSISYFGGLAQDPIPY